MPPNEEFPNCQQKVSDWHFEWYRAEGMSILTPKEKSFLHVFLHEATTLHFTGPATEALHGIGIEYGDISYIAWAYEQDVPRTSFEWGHAADAAPPLPWQTRESALHRNSEIQRIWEQDRKLVGAPKAS